MAATLQDPVEHVQKNTEAEEEVLKFVKEKYADELSKVTEDVAIRFVRGYSHEKDPKEATCSRLDEFFKVIGKHGYGSILDEEWEDEDVIGNAWKCYTYGVDKQGHPVMYDEIASASTTEIMKAFGGDMEKLKKFRMRFMQRVSLRKQKLRKKYGKQIYKHVLVMDMSGFTKSHLSGDYRNLVKEVIGQEQHYFPETLYKLYIVNASWVFRGLWNVIYYFVDPITREKIQVLGGSFTSELEKVVDKDQIPTKYGGTGKLEIVLSCDADDGKEQPKKKETKASTTKDDVVDDPDQKTPE